MIIQYQQETISDVNDLIAEIRSAAISLRHRDDMSAVNEIIDRTYLLSTLLQDGAFDKEAS